MEGRTRTHHGYQPRTSPTHQNFTKCSTSDTRISQDHRIVNRSWNGHRTTVQWTYCKFFIFSSLFSFFSFLSVPVLSLSTYFLYLLHLSYPHSPPPPFFL